jgi:hypothetical protein
MSIKHKPFSLAFDAETTRPGEQTFAGPDPLADEFVRRLRDVERAGRLRNLLCSAEVGAWESARFCRFTQGDDAAADAHLAMAGFYAHLLAKVRRLEARARGETL